MAIEPIRDAADPPAEFPGSGASYLLSSSALRPLDEAVDAGDFERRLLGLAVSPEGGGASRAWILQRTEAGRMEVSRSSDTAFADDASSRNIDPLQSGPAVAEAWRDARVAWSRESGESAPWRGAAATGAVGYRLDRGASRLMVAAWDRESEGSEARFVAVAQLARQSARALEAREGWRRSGEQRVALVEWLHAAAASHHVNEGLRAGARAALRVSGAQAVAIWISAAGAPPMLSHTAGETSERESMARALQALAVETAESGQVLAIERDSGVPSRLPPGLDRVDRVLLLPVTASGQVMGVLAALTLNGLDPAARDAAGEDATELLTAVADGLGMLFDRAARAEAQRGSEQQARELRARLRRRERLATVGERAAGALAEARHPLASIGAFARRAHRELEEADPRREYLEVILRESERLERLIAESSEPAAPELARLRMESLNAVLQDVLPGVGEKLVRRRVRLLKRLDPESPLLLLDVERIRQVFRNVIERAVDSVPVGGRVRIESRLIRDHVVAEIAFDGGHAPGDLLEELFVPFTPDAAHGAPGLGVADRVIRQHGGEIRVRADGEWGATVLITLPVQGNEERRRVRSDRRLTRSDRRLPAGPV